MKCVKSQGAHEESICASVWNRRFALVCLVETPNKACPHGAKTKETELRVLEEDSFDPGVPETSGIKE